MMFNSKDEAIQAFVSGETKDYFLLVKDLVEAGAYSNCFYCIYDMTTLSEDKLHLDTEMCITQDKDNAEFICKALNDNG